MADSLIRKKTAPSLAEWALNIRKKMLEEGNLIDYNKESYKLIENQLFKTPSGAGQMVTGRPTNGWVEWKNAAGQTLDSIYR